ncbi:Poly [ADP-ribose] polymerase 6 [Tritrichomonas musculus]|uniref:Poly [ADP-ribose] polymerase 6 n=1 Tax=Tritrichomonas musculus TaxID=1915356 RepID=A0ABR2HBV5_9EUKA
MSNPEIEKTSEETPEQIEFYEEEAHFNEEEAYFNEEEQFPDETPSGLSFNVSSSIETPPNDLFDWLIKDKNTCKAFFFTFDIEEPSLGKLIFRIPTSILPLTVSVVNGFYKSPYLIECVILFQETNPYKTNPDYYKFTNPFYDETFPGSVLLKSRFQNFFKPDYKPSTQYRCQNYVLSPQVHTDREELGRLVDVLVKEGFPYKKAENALRFCSNNIEQARDYLITGLLEQRSFPLPSKYADCPLFYLILEICEAFFMMCDCCCVCGKSLGVYHLKPACCNDKVCQYSFLNLGVGSNIVGEIKRDPLATDLIIALAGSAFTAPSSPPVFEPSPESQGIHVDMSFFDTLPSMKNICMNCQNDSDLIQYIGKNKYEILRFFILANKAQLITLPPSCRTSINASPYQFLITSVSPESELVFRSKKDKCGVMWLWHGSDASRWYRILHTGLKNMYKSEYQTHGGVGIFMSNSFYYSSCYCVNTKNIYKKSKLPKDFYVISLVENAKVSQLNFYINNEYTQQDESASITRVLFLIDSSKRNNNADFDVVINPPTVPTLNEVLNKLMEQFTAFV